MKPSEAYSVLFLLLQSEMSYDSKGFNINLLSHALEHHLIIEEIFSLNFASLLESFT